MKILAKRDQQISSSSNLEPGARMESESDGQIAPVPPPVWLLPSTGESQSAHGNPDPELDSEFDLECLLSDQLSLDEGSLRPPASARIGSARFGRRATPTPNQTPVTSPLPSPAATTASQPFRLPNGTAAVLEDKWQSLAAFEHNHLGRLCLQPQGDALDTYLTGNHDAIQESSNEANDSPAHNPLTPELQVPSDFIIPELPSGRTLVLDIRSTWGDRHYVGLNGIEVFCSSGQPVSVSRVWAQPQDINVLPQYDSDPRRPQNLVDGVYRTRDDLHLWLAPFTSGNSHTVGLKFTKTVQVALIRIWNYNKSRIHSYRGARYVEMMLDGVPIFRGEIARACGVLLGDTEAFGDTILFTTDEAILESISRHDSSYAVTNHGSDEPEEPRPPTNTSPSSTSVAPTPAPDYSERPFTAPSPRSVLIGASLRLTILSNWGSPGKVSASGLQLLAEGGAPITLLSEWMACDPPTSTLPRLCTSGGFGATDPDCTWSVPFDPSNGHPWVQIDLPERIPLIGLRLWNCNLSLEGSYQGIRGLKVEVDGRLASPPDGFLARRGPGNLHYDFRQDLLFGRATRPEGRCLSGPSALMLNCPGATLAEEYEAPVMPEGFVVQLLLLSSWGDPYYVGLNGIEIYGPGGDRIPLTKRNIAAYPESVNVLDKISHDVRTPDKLIDGCNTLRDGRHAWLAPILPGELNRVYAIFDWPVTISMIRLWNYAKTPSRGVKEFGVLVDDLLVYNGVLDKAPGAGAKGVPHRSVLFTGDPEVVRRERGALVRQMSGAKTGTGHGAAVNKAADHRSSSAPDQNLRPYTSLKASAPKRGKCTSARH